MVQVLAALRLLKITRTASPRIAPASIDSHGKPGIGGSARGVVFVEICCVVDELEAPVTTTLLEVSVELTA